MDSAGSPRKSPPVNGTAKLDALRSQIHRLEVDRVRETQASETRARQKEFCYQVHGGRVTFDEEATQRHRLLRNGFPGYVLHSRFLVLVTAPIIWMCAIPIMLADLVGTLYQYVCFPIYGIPRVPRGDYLAFDRHHLSYLNFIEKVNCEYCAYVNGILGYFTEIAARTEQHWCPIKHAGCVKCMHSRYKKFVDFGDAEEYRRDAEKVRRAYGDIRANGSSPAATGAGVRS